MNGRIRTIKPEILEDAVTAGLSDTAFRLFIAVIVLSDDYGRFRAEPGWLRGQVYWARDVAATHFSAALDDLVPLVRFYLVNGQRYGALRNWLKHQRVDKPGKPRIPPPPEDGEDPPESLARHSRESRDDLVPDLGSGIWDHGPRIRDLGSERGTVSTVAELVPSHDVASVGDVCTAAVAAVPTERKSGIKAKRGTRLPDGWTPSEEIQTWARANGIEPFAALEDFRDYWASIPGSRGVKLDWDLTYRRWIRRDGQPRAVPARRYANGHVQSGENRAWKVPTEMP